MNNLITGRSSNYCEKGELGMRTKAFYCLCFLFEGARPAIYCSHKTRGRKDRSAIITLSRSTDTRRQQERERLTSALTHIFYTLANT